MCNTTLKKDRILWLDIAKGLGILLVVVGHSNPPKWIRIAIFSFHMPLFFFLSGFVYQVKSSSVSMKRGIIKDLKKLILPYIVSICIIGLSLLILQAQGKKGSYDSWRDFWISALFGSGADYGDIKMIGGIWFLLTMFWARRFMDGLCFFGRNNIIRSVVLVMGLVFSILLASKRIWIATDIDIALYAVFFMYCGYSYQKRTWIGNNPIVLCTLLFVYSLSVYFTRFEMSNRNYYYLFALSLTGAVAMSIITCKLSMILSKIAGIRSFLSFIGRHSLLFRRHS